MFGIFLDTETNGLDPKIHKILEIAIKIIDLRNGKILDTYQTFANISDQEWSLSDPISLKVNGIKKENTHSGKSFGEIRQDIINLIKKHSLIRGKAVFICQNPSFDRAFFSQILDIKEQEQLYLPYHWLDLASMYWGFLMQSEKGEKLPWETGFTKDKIAAKFGIEPENQPHRAMNGVNHLLKCYEKVIGFPNRNSNPLKALKP